MKKFFSLTLLVGLLIITSCSTTTKFKIPEGTKLIVDKKHVHAKDLEEYKRTPFFWNRAAGIEYRLEKDGTVVEEGKLKAHFRVASIFWPPYSIIYWPIRFDGPYDLTEPNEKVRPLKK